MTSELLSLVLTSDISIRNETLPFLMLMLMSHCGSLVAYAYAYVASEDQALVLLVNCSPPKPIFLSLYSFVCKCLFQRRSNLHNSDFAKVRDLCLHLHAIGEEIKFFKGVNFKLHCIHNICKDNQRV